MQLLKNLRLAGKLGLGFGVIIALTVSIIGLTYSGVNSIKRDVNVLSDHVLNTELDLSNFKGHSAQARIFQFRVAGNQGETAQEMQVGTQKVSRAISDVASVSEESAACAEELNRGVKDVSVSVSELSDLAVGLQSQVAQFKLENQPKTKPTNQLKVA